MIYVTFGSLWILFSDTALHALVADAELEAQLQTVKGWFFVLVTGALVFLLARAMHRTYEAENRERMRAEADLTEALENAERANRAKSQFLATMSHEFRTPLNAILGFAQVMEMELLGGAPGSKYLDYARNIRTSGEILSALISDILDLSRIEAGKLDLEDEIFGIAPLMDDIGMLFRGQAEAVEVTLLVETAEEISDMRGDRKAVLQALMNLVSNAVTFTDAGGRIAVSANLDGNALCLAVADTGAGFDMAELDIVLEPFGRAQQAPGRRRAAGAPGGSGPPGPPGGYLAGGAPWTPGGARGSKYYQI